VWFTAAPKPRKIQVFWGSPSPQGSHSPYILGDTTRPRHVTYVLVWSKSDQRQLRKTLRKQTDKQTKQTDTTKIMVTWPWTNYYFNTTKHFFLDVSALTDHASHVNHVINWPVATILDRELHTSTRSIKEASSIRKEGRRSLNWDEKQASSDECLW